MVTPQPQPPSGAPPDDHATDGAWPDDTCRECGADSTVGARCADRDQPKGHADRVPGGGQPLVQDVTDRWPSADAAVLVGRPPRPLSKPTDDGASTE